jgi:hypothetical protein
MKGRVAEAGTHDELWVFELRYFPDPADTLDLADYSSRVDSMLHCSRYVSHMLTCTFLSYELVQLQALSETDGMR